MYYLKLYHINITYKIWINYSIKKFSSGQAKVINYRLIEELSQTFNEGLLLDIYKL